MIAMGVASYQVALSHQQQQQQQTREHQLPLWRPLLLLSLSLRFRGRSPASTADGRTPITSVSLAATMHCRIRHNQPLPQTAHMAHLMMYAYMSNFVGTPYTCKTSICTRTLLGTHILYVFGSRYSIFNIIVISAKPWRPYIYIYIYI